MVNSSDLDDQDDNVPLDTIYTFTCYVCPMRIQTNDMREVNILSERHKDCHFSEEPS